MLGSVPSGLRYTRFRLNSLNRATSGLMVAHLTPTPVLDDRMRRVDDRLIVGLVAVFDA